MPNPAIGQFRDAPFGREVQCPRCEKDMLPVGHPGALSRADNKTEICSACGMDEAMSDAFGDGGLGRYAEPEYDWPVKGERHPFTQLADRAKERLDP